MSSESEEQRERRFLVRRPRALQYFHQGKLYKTQEKERVAGRFELFFDLLFVALVANLADHLSEDPNGTNLVIYLLTFIPIWHVWADSKENANNYFNDDITQRVGILWVMALLVLFGNNAPFVGEDIVNLRVAVATYMVIRFTQSMYFLYYSMASHYHRTQNRMYVGMTLIALCLWIPLFFEEVSNRAKIAVTVVVLAWEEFSYILTFGPWVARWFKLKYTTAVDIDHENDRYTAFTIIILGEFTYAILVGSPAAGGLSLDYLRAVWTLVIAFCFNSMYVYCDGSLCSTHPVRRSVWSSFAWLMIHLPMSAGLLIGGHVSAASVNTELEFNQGHRWLWGGGLAVGYLSMWITAYLHHDTDPAGTLMMPKWLRLLPRLLATLIHALIPLAHEEELSTTSLVSIGAGVAAFTVIWETAGALEKGACFLESWREPLDDAHEVVRVKTEVAEESFKSV